MLQWTPDPGAAGYTIYRKAKADEDWGAPLATLPGSSRSFDDAAVQAGMAYEYQIVKEGSGYTGYGYIYCGINVPAIENRGKLVLITERHATAPLSAELARLEQDLVGDGWQVLRRDVSSNDTPASVRQLIKKEYAADPAGVSAVFLFGHVPVLQAGNIDYDGHGAHPMPADGYYGDMDDVWAASFLPPNTLLSDVELMVGRVDLVNLPGGNWPSETELLRNYLEKDHAWRHKQVTVERRALIGDRFETFDGEAFAASGWRNFGPFVGAAQTETADVSEGETQNRWMTKLASGTYLWAYGCGGGDVASIAWLGNHEPYQRVLSTDLVGQDAKAVFFMLFGSSFGRWDYGENNILRAVLASPSLGLTSCLAGRPHWFFHHMGLGEPIGYSARLTMNNSTLYRNEKNQFTRSLHIALMGDPTLRLDPVAPPCSLDVARTSEGSLLRWCPSADPVAGYYVYRAASPAGPFTRVTQSPVAEITFQDRVPSGTPAVYMVRAVALENHYSGSYYNLSQGVFSNVDTFGNVGNGLRLGITPVVNGLRLTWNTRPGIFYSLESCTDLTAGNWQAAFGPAAASDGSLSWTDTDTHRASKYYRAVESGGNPSSAAAAPGAIRRAQSAAAPALIQGPAAAAPSTQQPVTAAVWIQQPVAAPALIKQPAAAPALLQQHSEAASRIQQPGAATASRIQPKTAPGRKPTASQTAGQSAGRRSAAAVKPSPKKGAAWDKERSGVRLQRSNRVPGLFSGKSKRASSMSIGADRGKVPEAERRRSLFGKGRRR